MKLLEILLAECMRFLHIIINLFLPPQYIIIWREVMEDFFLLLGYARVVTILLPSPSLWHECLVVNPVAVRILHFPGLVEFTFKIQQEFKIIVRQPQLLRVALDLGFGSEDSASWRQDVENVRVDSFDLVVVLLVHPAGWQVLGRGQVKYEY